MLGYRAELEFVNKFKRLLAIIGFKPHVLLNDIRSLISSEPNSVANATARRSSRK